MEKIVLGMQGGIANGSEPTFDGQPMQPGVHLRWSFLAALGFPPGGFWLCRRAAQEGEKRIPPPPTEGCNPAEAVVPTSPTGAPRVSSGPAEPGVAAVTASSAGSEWQATMAKPCQSVTLAGCAAPGCDEVIIETFARDAKGDLKVTGRRTVQVERGCFRIRVQAKEISGVRVSGAGSVDECGCTVEPPEDCGCGGDGGGGNQGGGNPPCYGVPGWGKPNQDGWQCWGVPFTLPVTVASWPARYYGAPDPATTPAALVEKSDILEAERRLGSLRLAAGMTAASQRHELGRLRAELVRLVQAFPATLLADVPIQDSAAGANAPNLNLSLMQELLLLALDPYFARVLGLYFVDDQVVPGVHYDYAITGFWGATPCQSPVVFPGLAPGAPLARGNATFGGITIEPLGGTSLWRWTKYDGQGNFLPRLDPSAPSAAAPAVASSISGFAQAQLPDALLLALTTGSGFPFFTPAPQVTIALSQPVPRVDVQVAGVGTVVAMSEGAGVSTAGFSSGQLTTVTVNAASPTQTIDTLVIAGVPGFNSLGIVVTVGGVTLHPVSPDAIGTRYAILPPPIAIPSLPAPGQPISTFRHRQAEIDTATLSLVTHSLIDVEWPAPPVGPQPGDPVSNPLALPPPTLPIGFIAERQDTGAASSTQKIPGWIATRSAPKPKASLIPTANLYRYADSQLGDPAGGWSHRVAAFDLFGALGQWSNWSVPRGIEKIAAAPTAMRIVQFDNSTAGGGSAAADGSAWTGGTLRLLVNWSGAAFLMYPDIETARVTVDSLDLLGNATEIATLDLDVPRPTIQALTIASVDVTPAADGNSYTVDIQTTPALTALVSFDPGQVLLLTLADGTTERYAVRPGNPLAPDPGPIVARVTAGNAARIVATAGDFVGRPAYLLSGASVKPTLTVPLEVPIAQKTAKAQVYVTGSTQNPFLANEQIVDPNGTNLPRPEPSSVNLFFNAPQRLVPAAPPTPVHDVHHVYYDPADATGQAGKELPFATPGGAGVSGYVLQRAAVRSLAIADIKRRIALANLADNNPVVLDGGTPRADLAAWIASLGDWLASYNAGNGTAWTVANVLEDTAAQRAFLEHFYGGLLDDELRALGDLPEDAGGYARVNPQPVAAGTAIADSVDGTGYGRALYRLAAVNAAGSFSSTTGSIGPYYTRIVTPPRPPVLYKLQATESAIVVAWALDTNPDVAAYMVYRAASVEELADLRYFGADWTKPAAANLLPTVQFNQTSYPPLSFVQGVGLNVDQRIVGFVPDPRLCARDYDGSDAGEIVLPPGPPPDEVNGIYRLSDYNGKLDPLSQAAFNYWTPPSVGGIAQIVVDTPAQSRLTGLRIGLGRGVPVVVVLSVKGQVKVLGQVPVRRAAFVDGVSSGGAAFDPNAIAGAPPLGTMLNAYAVVAIDIFGNRSAPSKVFAARMLAKAAGA